MDLSIQQPLSCAATQTRMLQQDFLVHWIFLSFLCLSKGMTQTSQIFNRPPQQQ